MFLGFIAAAVAGPWTYAALDVPVARVGGVVVTDSQPVDRERGLLDGGLQVGLWYPLRRGFVTGGVIATQRSTAWTSELDPDDARQVREAAVAVDVGRATLFGPVGERRIVPAAEVAVGAVAVFTDVFTLDPTGGLHATGSIGALLPGAKARLLVRLVGRGRIAAQSGGVIDCIGGVACFQYDLVPEYGVGLQVGGLFGG